MKLAKINRVLRCLGLVLVVSIGSEDEPTEIWIEWASSYDRRTGA